MDRIVGEVCRKDVVLLGVDSHHGSRKTLEINIEIANSLIGQCHFSAVFFEGRIYDFFGLQQALTRKSTTQAQVADAIGGLWSTTGEMDPLIDHLFQDAVDGKISLAGLDPQTGGAPSFYTQQELPLRLARYLRWRRSAECEIKLHRLTNWEYDDKSAMTTTRHVDYDPASSTSGQALPACVARVSAAHTGPSRSVMPRVLPAALPGLR